MNSRLIFLTLFIFSVCIICDADELYWNSTRGYVPFAKEGDRTLVISSTKEPAEAVCTDLPYQTDDFILSFRCSNRHNIPYRTFTYTAENGSSAKTSYPGWSLVLKGNGNYVRFHFKPIEAEDALSSTAALEITAESAGNLQESRIINKDIELHDGLNSFRIIGKEGLLLLKAGNREYNDILKLPAGDFAVGSFGFESDPGGEIEITDISMKMGSDGNKMSSLPSEDIENAILRSTDPLVGYWAVFDRNFEENLLRMGGDYILAIIPDAERYLIVYLSGATKNPDSWKKGMVKGLLSPSPFDNVFLLEWMDAELKPISNELKAQLEDDILSVNFPYHNSSLRLRKLRRSSTAD